MSNDIFTRKKTEVTPKNSGGDKYLEEKKTKPQSKDFKERFLNPQSDLKSGQNVRLHKETHALLKAISLEENRELYSIMQESLKMYLNNLTKEEQKNVWEKLNSLIELKIIKIN